MYHQINPLLPYLCTSLLSLLVSIILAWGGLSSAHAFYVGAVEVEVVDASQNSLPSYNHRGQHFVMGRYNQRYMLKVINHSSQRLELSRTVDGRDVINGSAGHYGNRGYVLNPHSHFNIEGFRRSDTEVAAFRFTTLVIAMQDAGSRQKYWCDRSSHYFQNKKRLFKSPIIRRNMGI